MRRTSFAVIVALALSLTPNALGAVARAVEFNSKVQEAEAIVLGTCVRKESAFDSTGRWIVTRSTFKVSRTFKGSTPAEITIVTPGGEVNGLHQETIGVPNFGEGDVNVLFVRNSSIGPTVLYFDQGTYRVRDERGGSVVAPVESDLVLLDEQTGRARTVSDEAPRSLDEFEQQVRNALQLTRRTQ